MGKIVQTAGRNTLGEFAPEFAHFNDDVLFGENWNNQDIDVKTRSIITVVALMASGITDSSLKYHLQNAKNHGVTQKEIAAVITHVAFYAGWPKAWACFYIDILVIPVFTEKYIIVKMCKLRCKFTKRIFSCCLYYFFHILYTSIALLFIKILPTH